MVTLSITEELLINGAAAIVAVEGLLLYFYFYRKSRTSYHSWFLRDSSLGEFLCVQIGTMLSAENAIRDT